MHAIRNSHSHLKRQDLLPPIFSSVSGAPSPTPIITLGILTNIIPSAPSSTSLSSSSSSTSFTSESSNQTSSSISQTLTSTTPTATPSVYETTSGGSVHTVTTVVDASPSPTESAPAGQSFLQNKVLSGVVLAFASLAGLIVIIVVATFAIRRRRHNRLLQEAISFDPVSTNGNHYHGAKGSMEKLSVNADNSHGFKITLPWMQERSPEPGKEYECGSNHNLRGP